MARGPSTFRQRDLTRAIKAAIAAGMTVERAWVEVDGRIMLGFSNPNVETEVEDEADSNSWDKALAS